MDFTGNKDDKQPADPTDRRGTRKPTRPATASTKLRTIDTALWKEQRQRGWGQGVEAAEASPHPRR